jgi:hypothetical protein
MITFIVGITGITVANNTVDNYFISADSGNEIVFDNGLSNCYLEYCDNSDDYERDEEGYEEWTKFTIADDGESHPFIDDTNGDVNIVEFLKSFDNVNVVVKNDRGAEIGHD